MTNRLLASLCAAWVMFFASCSNDAEEKLLPNDQKQEDVSEADTINLKINLSDYQFTVDADDSITSTSVYPLSEDIFQSEIVGYGWEYIEGHRINQDGSIDPVEYALYILGSSVPQYYFTAQTMKEYTHAIGPDWEDVNTMLEYPYIYHEDTGIIIMQSYTLPYGPAEESMTILSYDLETKLLAVLHHEVQNDEHRNRKYQILFYRQTTSKW